MTKWTSLPIVDLSKNIRKNKKSIKVVNPKFFALSLVEEDQVWIEIFVNGGNGKFPKGFSWGEKDEVIKFRSGARVFDLIFDFPKVDTDPPFDPDTIRRLEVIRAQIKDFFHLYGVIFSPTDRKNNEDKQMTTMNSDGAGEIEMSAKVIRKNPVVLDHYLNKWVTERTEKENLSQQDIDGLWYIAKFGFTFGLLNDKDIEYNPRLNTITNINNICVMPNCRGENNYYISDERFEEVLKKKKTFSKKVIMTPAKKMWTKYMSRV